MRRPAFLGVLAAIVLYADPASAQRQIRRAFEPAITPFVAATGFEDRVHAAATTGDSYGYNNGIAIGVQAERPWTRRTALMATVALTPTTHVTRTFAETIQDRARITILGLDAGIAGRLKPSAAIFGYLGAGTTIATSPPADEGSGIHAEPRVTLGVGFDAMRRERTGLRLAYMSHFVFARTPAGAYESNGTVRDWTLVLGGRYTLGDPNAEATR